MFNKLFLYIPSLVCEDILCHNLLSGSKRSFGKVWNSWDERKPSELVKHGLTLFNLFSKGNAAYYFLNSRGIKHVAVDSETVCLWPVDHSFDRAIKTLCCL